MEDTDVWIMVLECVWTCVSDTEYPVAPILYAPASKPPRLPTAEEEAIAQEHRCRIKEEDHVTDDDVGTP